MTKDEVMEIATSVPGMMDAVLVGDVDDRETYYPAIVGHDPINGVFIYDHGLLTECFADSFKRSDESKGNPIEDMDHYLTEALEWIDFNVIRSLPYLGPHAPLIVVNDDEGNQVAYNNQ